MKKIYFLFLFCVFSQVLFSQTENKTQNDEKIYALAIDLRGSVECGGRNGGCTGEQLSALRNGQSYQALGDLSFDKYGRVILELKKSSLNEELQNDIYADGLLSLPNGFLLPQHILIDKGLIGIAERIPPGDYIALEEKRTITIILGKLN